MTWEYRVIPVFYEKFQRKVEIGGRTHKIEPYQWVAIFSDREPLQGFQEVCDLFGGMGWELTSTQRQSNLVDGSSIQPNVILLFFKRPKVE